MLWFERLWESSKRVSTQSIVRQVASTNKKGTSPMKAKNTPPRMNPRNSSGTGCLLSGTQNDTNTNSSIGTMTEIAAATLFPKPHLNTSTATNHPNTTSHPTPSNPSGERMLKVKATGSIHSSTFLRLNWNCRSGVAVSPIAVVSSFSTNQSIALIQRLPPC